MTLIELKALLEATGLPVAYSHFTPSKNSPVPSPPYICYLESSSSNFFADGKVYKKIIDVSIELYTDKKDLQLESQLEEKLDEKELTYESYGGYIESEKLFQKTYEVRLI